MAQPGAHPIESGAKRGEAVHYAIHHADHHATHHPPLPHPLIRLVQLRNLVLGLVNLVQSPVNQANHELTGMRLQKHNSCTAQ